MQVHDIMNPLLQVCVCNNTITQVQGKRREFAIVFLWDGQKILWDAAKGVTNTSFTFRSCYKWLRSTVYAYPTTWLNLHPLATPTLSNGFPYMVRNAQKAPFELLHQIDSTTNASMYSSQYRTFTRTWTHETFIGDTSCFRIHQITSIAIPITHS